MSPLSLVAGLITGISTFSRASLPSGSARATQTFVQTAIDPMERISKHFGELIGWMGNHPVMVFIDDLDRCQSEYAVNLLEGIQTLFKDPRVIYLISGDRRWLNTCYEKVYKEFSESIKEPGRSSGSLFLEKAVQLSVSLPRLTFDLQERYWDYLIGQGEENEDQLKINAKEQAKTEFQNLKTPDEIAGAIRPDSSPFVVQSRREQAVLQLATERAERLTAHFLQDLVHLFEPNPRAMKRLLNAYAFHRDLGILAGSDVFQNSQKRKQLVLWTIVCLRWPILVEAITENLQYVDLIRPKSVKETSDELQALFKEAPESMQKLLRRPSVRAVFTGENLAVILDQSIIQEFIGIRTSNSSASPVG